MTGDSDPSNAELARLIGKLETNLRERIDEVKADTKEDIASLRAEVAQMGIRHVSSERYAADMRGNADRHARNEAEISNVKAEQEKQKSVAGEREKDRRAARLALAVAIVGPVLVAVLPLLLRTVS